jgi:RNA polymerase sigma factor (TIGR02999 family)
VLYIQRRRPGPAFPLQTAEGGRYVVDQNGSPFLIAGKSPQALMVIQVQRLVRPATTRRAGILDYGGPSVNTAEWQIPLGCKRERGDYTTETQNGSRDPRPVMSEVTGILTAIEQGDPSAADQLLPLVYDELRRLATHKLAQEKPGQTLQATALVHEAYLRLVDTDQARHWSSRGHFFAAAAEAMRRILVENARRKTSLKRGGCRVRQTLDEEELAAPQMPDHLLALDEALSLLAATDEKAAKLVTLRYFAGLTLKQAAEVLGISSRKADLLWAFARAWLLRKIEGEEPTASPSSP